MREQDHGELINSRYLLNGVSGRGGWGITYRAHDLLTGRDVALKMSRASAGTMGLNSLSEELALVRRIQHKGVIQYYDYGMHDSRPIIVMELLNAPSLEERTHPHQDFTDHEVTRIFSQTCEALAALHAARVIHCDLKPQNLIDVPGKGIKIIDFGLAKGLDKSLRASSQLISGTPNYMAPEQLRMPTLLSPETDIYSLALLTVWLCTGQLQWSCGDVELLRWRLRSPASLPTSLELLPSPLRYALTQALSEDPRDRPQHALEFRDSVLDSLYVLERGAAHIPLNKYGQQTILSTSWLTTVSADHDSVLETVDASTDPINRQRDNLALGVFTLPTSYIEDTLNAGHESRAQALQYGISEDLIDLLNASPKLSVCPFERSRQVPVSEDDLNPKINWSQLADYAERCEVEIILILRIIYTEEKVHLQTQTFSLPDRLLISRSEVHLLHSDILSQLGGVAFELARQLRVTLSCPSAERATRAEAIELLFRARELSTYTWHSDVSEALNLFEQAADRSPQDAVILADMARVKARSSFIGAPPNKDALPPAIQLAERAFKLAPHHPRSLWALGYIRFYQGEYQEAIRLLEEAITLGADRAEIRDLIGRVLCETGPIKSAIYQLEHVLKVDRSMLMTKIDLARLYAYSGRWDRVNALLDEEVDGDFNFGARAISRARMDLWRPEASRWDHDRDPEREGALFCSLIEVFSRVRTQGKVTSADYKVLSQLIETSPSGSRLKVLYIQFLSECLASVCGPRHPDVQYMIKYAKDEGLKDQLWLRYCPLLCTGEI